MTSSSPTPQTDAPPFSPIWAGRLRALAGELVALRTELADAGEIDPLSREWPQLVVAAELVESAAASLDALPPADAVATGAAKEGMQEGGGANAAVLAGLAAATGAIPDHPGVEDEPAGAPALAPEERALLAELRPRLHDVLDDALIGLSLVELRALAAHPYTESALVLLAVLGGRADSFGERVERLYTRMQDPSVQAATAKALDAAPKELGQAAVAALRARRQRLHAAHAAAAAHPDAEAAPVLVARPGVRDPEGRPPLHTVVGRHHGVHSGALVFAGTRVPVSTLTDHLMDGATLDDFLVGYPTVARWQAEAALCWVPAALDTTAEMVGVAEIGTLRTNVDRLWRDLADTAAAATRAGLLPLGTALRVELDAAQTALARALRDLHVGRGRSSIIRAPDTADEPLGERRDGHDGSSPTSEELVVGDQADDAESLRPLAYAAALEATGSSAYAAAWWTSPSGRLNGRTPADVAAEGPAGRVRVRDAIKALAGAGGMP